MISFIFKQIPGLLLSCYFRNIGPIEKLSFWGLYAYRKPMRRKTLVPATQDPAGITNEVPTFGQAQRSDLPVDNSQKPSSELPTSGSALILGHPSGVSPAAYNLRRAIERALNLLKRESVTLARVFQDSGFETEAQFLQAFCDMIGVTPSIYRENVLIAKSVADGRTGPG